MGQIINFLKHKGIVHKAKEWIKTSASAPSNQNHGMLPRI